jgi:hypothetical protein
MHPAQVERLTGLRLQRRHYYDKVWVQQPGHTDLLHLMCVKVG